MKNAHPKSAKTWAEQTSTALMQPSSSVETMQSSNSALPLVMTRIQLYASKQLYSCWDQSLHLSYGTSYLR
jgi:hypothetical protein